MEKTTTQKIKDFVLRKRILIPLGLFVLFYGGYKVLHMNDAAKNTVTDTVKSVTLKQTVLATGQVTSNTDLNLSFNGTGVVTSINTKVGSTVQKGQILATLSGGSVGATLTSARGAVAAAKAKYKKILDGASNEEISLATVAYENAKRDYDAVVTQQDTLVKNARTSLLSGGAAAYTSNINNAAASSLPTISGSYDGPEGEYKINIYVASNGGYFTFSGIENGTGQVSSTTAVPLGSHGLFIQFPVSYVNASNDTLVVSLPNKQAAVYTLNFNAYQAAMKTQASAISAARSIVSQREAELALKKSAARPADLDLAEADMLQAQGQLEQAQAAYENTLLRAPAEGTITSVDIKVGELAQALKEVMVLQDVKNMYLEANINEANIANVRLGAPVSVNFDAFGVDKVYTGAITQVDPASTLVSGVVNYKIKSTVEAIDGLRPGMTANMTINIAEKQNALVVPARSILTDANGNKVLRIINNTKKKTYTEVPVSLGLAGDGGMTEITSGVALGDEFVVLIKQ